VVITITTNDSAVLAWSTATTNIAETGGTLTLTVNRTGTTNNAVTVNFTTTNVTATGDVDYATTNGTLSFAPGETSQTISVDVSDDDLQEANETFRVVLSNPTDATLGIGTNTVTITDDDGSIVSFTTNAVSVLETNDSVTLTVVRSGATNTAVAIDFTTTNVTATADDDYTGNDGTLVFAPGETTNTIVITLTDDLLYEGNQTFRVILSGITNSSLSIGTNTVTITDDDVAYLGFTASADAVNELDGTIVVTVERTGSVDTEVSVAYATTNLTATAGADYTATSGVLTFAAGETNATITVDIAFDDDIESPETFRIRLFSLTNAAPAAITNLTVTINDAFGGTPPPPSIVSISSINALSAAELRLRVTGPIGAGVVIEATTNFTNWEPVATNTLTTTTWDWVTPIDPVVPARYFRVVPPR
jgi:chitinase